MVSSLPLNPEDSPLRVFESRQLHQGAGPASVSPRRCAQVLPVTATFSSERIRVHRASTCSPAAVAAAVVRTIHAPSHTMARPRITPPVR